MAKLITGFFTTLGFVIGITLSLALIMSGVWALGLVSAIVATTVISIGLAAIFGVLGYTIARFARTARPCISPNDPESTDNIPGEEDDEDWFPCFSRSFFKDPEQENLIKALRSYTKNCQAQEIELQEITTTLTLINEEWNLLCQRKTSKIDKLLNENPTLVGNYALNTKTPIGDDRKAERISRIKELVNSYPKLGPGNKTANEVLETVRQRILHHEDLKNLMDDFLTEDAESINLSTNPNILQFS